MNKISINGSTNLNFLIVNRACVSKTIKKADTAKKDNWRHDRVQPVNSLRVHRTGDCLFSILPLSDELYF